MPKSKAKEWNSVLISVPQYKVCVYFAGEKKGERDMGVAVGMPFNSS